MQDRLAIFRSIEGEGSEYDIAKKIIEYTLYIDLSKKAEGGNIIDGIWGNSYKLCKEYNIKSEFFGETIRYDANKFIEDALKQHCILSSLYTAKYLRYREKRLYLDQVGNDLGGIGLWTLYREKIIKKKNGEVLFETRAKGNIYEARSSFRTKYNQIRKGDKPYAEYKYFKEMARIGMEDISLYNSDFIAIVIKNIHLFKDKVEQLGAEEKWYKVRNIAERYKYFIEQCYLCQLNKDKQLMIDKVDKILFEYQLERTYNYKLIVHIIKVFNEFYYRRENSPHMVLGSQFNEVIKRSLILPNVFTRNEFVEWAILNSENMRVQDNQYSRRESLKNAMLVSQFQRNLNEVETINMWLELYDKFISHVSYITIPLLEKVFFIKLYENYCDSSKEEVLDEMIKGLYQHINNQFNKIQLKNYSHIDRVNDIGQQKDRDCIVPLERVDIRGDSGSALFKKLISYTFEADNIEEKYIRIFDKRYFLNQKTTQEIRDLYLKSILDKHHIY